MQDNCQMKNKEAINSVILEVKILESCAYQWHTYIYMCANGRLYVLDNNPKCSSVLAMHANFFDNRSVGVKLLFDF